MVRATRERVKVAELALGDALVAFYEDGTAELSASATLECQRCGALHDWEGQPLRFTPDQSWHLAQALRQHMGAPAYRQACEAIRWAIEGPAS